MACGVEQLVKHYMDDLTFRQLVHNIHDHIDIILANKELPYIALV
ncbi:hypothetical protein PHMEG_00014193 [Phytophthora megakarya]|uniref:Uncharacterized protein n=1 Tax=Phytophthora megakarya TaxID=4795 RepID=A0A225W5G9_9STRA|nr:hypothetical protein PHMEG_00014193 [Phytophthora megakarya]